MRSVKLDGQGVVRIVEAPDPVPGPGEVVIETAASALCGSEMHTYRGAGQESGNTGHEAAGVVVAVGEGVDSLAAGQRVGISAVVGCGQCAECVAGRYTWCPQWRGYGSMHAERFVAAARACHRLDEDIPWAGGVLVSGDGFGVPFHTSRKISDAAIETVAVFGVGPIGLGSVLLQAHLGRRVVAVDVSPFRLALARRLGAAEALDAGDGDVVERVRAWAGAAGADAAIEAAGCPETAKQCFAVLRPGGTVVFNGEQPSVELSPSDDFIRRDITAVGSWYYHFHEFAQMVALYRGGLAVDQLISHRYPLHDAQAGYNEFSAGRTGKVLLTYAR